MAATNLTVARSGPQAGAAVSVESVTNKSQISVGFIYLFIYLCQLCSCVILVKPLAHC